MALGDLAGWLPWSGLILWAPESSVFDSKVFLSQDKTSGVYSFDRGIYRRVHL